MKRGLKKNRKKEDSMYSSKGKKYLCFRNPKESPSPLDRCRCGVFYMNLNVAHRYRFIRKKRAFCPRAAINSWGTNWLEAFNYSWQLFQETPCCQGHPSKTNKWASERSNLPTKRSLPTRESSWTLQPRCSF
jgi:hypothetical protein